MKEIKNISFRQFYFFYLKKKKKEYFRFSLICLKNEIYNYRSVFFMVVVLPVVKKKNNNNVFGGVCMLFLVDGSVSMRVKLSD